ncbi:hypothetical protein AAG906_016547 [Vitis piasezkii]
MSKLGSMLVKHKEESNNWKRCIGPKIEDKVLQNIAKGEVYPVTSFMNGVFGICIRRALLNVDIMNCTCTCRCWQILRIPCEHVAAIIISIGQNVLISLMIATNTQCKSQGRSTLSPNFKINGRSIALIVICPVTIEKRVGIFCPKCISVTLLYCSDLVLPYLN